MSLLLISLQLAGLIDFTFEDKSNSIFKISLCFYYLISNQYRKGSGKSRPPKHRIAAGETPTMVLNV